MPAPPRGTRPGRRGARPRGRRGGRAPGGGRRAASCDRRRGADRRRQRQLALAVEVGGRLVEQQQRRLAQEGAGEADALRLASGEAAGALADAGSHSLRQLQGDLQQAGVLGGNQDPLRRGPGRRQPHVLLDRAGEQRRPLRHPGDPAPPFVGVDVAQVDAAAGDRPLVGFGQPRQQRDQGRLAAAAGADQGHRLPRLQPQVDAAQDLGPARVREAHAGQLDRLAAGVGRRQRSCRRPHRRRLVEDFEDPLGARHPVGRGVELGAELAQRHVDLGGEDQHGQPGGQPEVPARELDPDRGGDQRHPDHRQQLQHQGREEADPQRLHRLLAVALAGGGDRVGLGLGAAVGAQGLEPADEVEEAGREAREPAPAPARRALG